MPRKNRFSTFQEAAARGAYDEYPMLEVGIDPQLHLSRNTIAQPFFLICEQDTMIAQLSGTARIEFRHAAVNYFDAEIGDFVYVPGGTPHRIVPKSESIQLRYKAEHPGLEAVAWYAEQSDREISRVTWDCADELPQEAYFRACRAFNATPAMRTCPDTGTVLPPIDLLPFRWEAVAAEIKAAEAAEWERARRKGVVPPVRRERDPDALTIGSAAPDKAPLKANAYEHARMAPTALAPLFPYFTPGSMVPCAIMQGQKRDDRGYFIHRNTVQEVNLCLGAQGAPFPFPGMVAVGPLTHPVGDKPGQPPGAAYSVMMLVITQRQATGEPQNESTMFHCEKCDAELFRRDYDAYDFPGNFEGPADSQIIGLPTISQSAASAVAFNESTALRTCKSCGHLNPPFPHESWGWEDYRQRTQWAVKARQSMIESARALTTP
jgi:hypothetical protein